ncbi:MAG: tyrosine phosphatase family protein [Methylovirgula sp.]
MPRIHVCSLFQIADVTAATGARSLITLINQGVYVDRPAAIPPERHLQVAISDVSEEMEGHILADTGHIQTLIDFIRAWDRAEPLVIHCFAGVSRSTAGAYIAACVLNPQANEAEIARRLRRASPTATPNVHLVGLADQALGRDGRMIAAIREIGRGADCMEAEPFALELD